MQIHSKVALVACALTVGVTPALAVANGHPTNPTHKPHGNAYGVLCANQSRKHVAGSKGTPFSQCVTAMAKIKNGQTKSPAVACSKMSKKHEAGKPGTPFSRCVSSAKKLLASK